jgi:hypothetical protein
VKRGRPTKEILAELKTQMKDPQSVDGTLEWVQRLARRDSKELLRGLIDALVTHIQNPPSRSRGRPAKARSAVTVDDAGCFTIDLTASPLLTNEQASRQFRQKLADFGIFEEVAGLEKRFTVVGAIAGVARKKKLSVSKVRGAYYRVKNSK